MKTPFFKCLVIYNYLVTYLTLGDARHLRQECYTSQRVRSERDSNLTYVLRADHEFHCSNTAPINHKVPGCVSTRDDSQVTSYKAVIRLGC